MISGKETNTSISKSKHAETFQESLILMVTAVIGMLAALIHVESMTTQDSLRL